LTSWGGLQVSKVRVIEFCDEEDIVGTQSFFDLLYPRKKSDEFDKRAELHKWLDLKIRKKWTVAQIHEDLSDQLQTLGVRNQAQMEKIWNQYLNSSLIEDGDYLNSLYQRPAGPPCKYCLHQSNSSRGAVGS
jgi:hypothetical protein